MTSAIELRGLTHRFAAASGAALDDVSADIPLGGISGLVGPDGAGKTTLMRLMAGLLKATAGTLSVVGLDPLQQGAALRSVLGYMPQKFGLYEDLTVQENLDLYADLRDVVAEERRRSFAELLAFTDLAAFTDRPAGKLSGGMKQKLGLACVLLGKPLVSGAALRWEGQVRPFCAFRSQLRPGARASRSPELRAPLSTRPLLQPPSTRPCPSHSHFPRTRAW